MFDDWSGLDDAGRPRPTEAERRIVEAAFADQRADCVGISDPDERIVAAELLKAILRGTLEVPGSETDAAPRRLDAPPVGGLRAFGLQMPQADDGATSDLVLFGEAVRRGLLDVPPFETDASGDPITADQRELLSATCVDRLRAGRIRVRGELDLSRLRHDRPLVLRGFFFENAVNLAEARIEGAGVLFDDCCFQEPLLLVNATVEGQLSLNRTAFTQQYDRNIGAQQATFGGGVFLTDAVVRGTIDVTSATIRGPFQAVGLIAIGSSGSVTIRAQGLRADQFEVARGWVCGAVSLSSAEIESQITLNGAKLRTQVGAAVNAQGVRCNSIFAIGLICLGTFDINSAHIRGTINLLQADIHTMPPSEGTDRLDAINAQYTRCVGVRLDRAVCRGQVDFNSSVVEGRLVADGATFFGMGGYAFRGDGGRFEGAVRFGQAQDDDGVFRCDIIGGVDLSQARFSRSLGFFLARIVAHEHLALRLDGTEVGGDAEFQLTLVLGMISAARTRFSRRLSFFGATLSAARFAAQDPVEADDPIDGARPSAGHDTRASLFALDLEEAEVTGRLTLPAAPPRGIVDLTRASCDTLDDLASGWPPPLRGGTARLRVLEGEGDAAHEVDAQHLVLDGFRCAHFEHPDGTAEPGSEREVADARTAWLLGQRAREIDRHFNPQPWRMAAGVLRDMGYDEAANRLSIRRRVQQRRSSGTGRGARVVSWLLEKVAEYGYNPWRTVWVSLGVILLSAGLYWYGDEACAAKMACALRDGAIRAEPLASDAAAGRLASVPHAFVPVRVGDAPNAYPRFNPLLYSIDVFVPILDLNTESFWRADREVVLPGHRPLPWVGAGWRGATVSLGWILFVVAMLERLLGAVLTAIAIVGFTGLVRREEGG